MVQVEVMLPNAVAEIMPSSRRPGDSEVPKAATLGGL